MGDKSYEETMKNVQKAADQIAETVSEIQKPLKSMQKSYEEVQKAYKTLVDASSLFNNALTLRQELALNLLDYSRLYGKTQKDLCEETGIPKSSMSSYFSGARYPRPEQLEALAKCFNITVGQLVGKTLPEDEKIDDLPIELRVIAREGRRLSKEQREALLRYCMYAFPEIFDPSDEDNPVT